MTTKKTLVVGIFPLYILTGVIHSPILNRITGGIAGQEDTEAICSSPTVQNHPESTVIASRFARISRSGVANSRICIGSSP
jgi:hypothetical protein